MKKPVSSKGVLLIAAGVLILVGSGLLHPQLIRMRQTENLQQVPPEDTTPLVTLTTVAFGGFRGLVADALWVRAAEMQESGQYFELVQLAKWITQLEPRVPEVWSFQAWNLAYNISVLFPDSEDRWRWVSHGVDLLKQEGLKHNPTSASLHWDIGWMYQHKIGMDFDLAHRTYKRNLAENIGKALPGGRLPENGLSDQAKQILRQEFKFELPIMNELESLYGPLDWRLSDTQSLYWSTAGLDFRATSFQTRSLRRMQLQSLAGLMRGGRLVVDSDNGQFITLPRPELIPILLETYKELMDDQPENRYLDINYQNFLYSAMVLLGEYGRISESLDLYMLLAEVDDSLSPDRSAFQAFLQQNLAQDPSTLTRTQAMTRTVALLQNASNPDISDIRSRGYQQMAKQVHRLYQQSRQNEEHLKRTGLPPFEVMQGLLSQVN